MRRVKKGIKDDENMESPNILMSHVPISMHTIEDGGQSVNCDNVLLHVVLYTISKNRESYRDRLSREVSQRKVEPDLTPSWIWQILNLETSFMGKLLSSSWTVPSGVGSPEARGEAGRLNFIVLQLVLQHDGPWKNQVRKLELQSWFFG